MNRREFIKLNSIAAGGLLLPNPFPFSFGSNKKVVVIGAGASGAMAARTLKDAGCEVVVLEARGRIGGRINSVKKWETSLELGANWISYASTKGNLVSKYQRQVGIETSPTSYANLKLYDSRGESISRLSAGLTSLRIESALEKKYGRESGAKDISLAEAINSISDYDNAPPKKKAKIDILKEGSGASIGASTHEASARAYSSYDPNLKEDEQLVTNGYHRLLDHLLDEIDVRLNQPVKEIQNKANEVTVITEKEIISADYVIVTVPISLLQNDSIKISPSPSEQRKKAFGSMQMGLFNKAVMKFTDKFWKGDPHFFAFQKEVQKNSGIVFNYHSYTNKPILIAFHVGDSGKWLEKSDDNEVKEYWRSIFHRSFPNRDIEFDDFVKSTWQKEQFSQGSYSHVPVGTTAADVEKLFAPIGRIHFAGEATSFKWHGYVHGALESGLREANRIIGY